MLEILSGIKKDIPRYRQLEIGEKILPGDKYLSRYTGELIMSTDPNSFVGTPNKNSMQYYRPI